MEAETQGKHAQKIRIVQNSTFMGSAWFAAWLFTIGFAKLVWWKALLALMVWPYFLGMYMR